MTAAGENDRALTREDPMPSPLEHLYPYILPALARVAPERARELQRLVDELGIRFQYDDTSSKMVLKANHATNTITIGLRALQRLWVRAYAYLYLYEHITRLQLADVTARAWCQATYSFLKTRAKTGSPPWE
jgi:hypothetical protein